MGNSQSQLEISKGGIKTSYFHFLTASAPGLLLYLLIICAYLFEYKLFGHKLSFQITQENSLIFLALAFILFLLVPTIGLLITSLSWFFLGIFQRVLVDCIFEFPYLLRNTLRFNIYFLWRDKFNVFNRPLKKVGVRYFLSSYLSLGEKKNQNVGWFMYHFVVNKMLGLYNDIDSYSSNYIQGMKVFLRSATLIFFLMLLHELFYPGYNNSPSLTGTFTLIAVSTFVLMIFITVYTVSETFAGLYLILYDRVKSKKGGINLQECMELLSKKR